MNIQGRSFTVLGAGRSGIGAAKLLIRNGADVILYDKKRESMEKYGSVKELESLGIKCVFGEPVDEMFESEWYVKSPGIPSEEEIVVRAKAKGEVVSEIEIASWFFEGNIIAITGTNGKTTTTALTGEILKAADKETYVCGNIGLAFSEVVEKAGEDSWAVVEVSSFQLEDIKDFKPKISAILNVTPDHIDRHGTFENYTQAKLNIFKNQDENDMVIYNCDNEVLRELIGEKETKCDRASFGLDTICDEYTIGTVEEGKMVIYNNGNREEIIDTKDILLRGKHNIYNSLAAMIAARTAGVEKEIIAEVLKTFGGVEHRIELVREIKGVKFYNDSKATNVDSLQVALESFDKGIVLILGGKYAENDYSPVAKLINDRVKIIVAIGESRPHITSYFKGKKEVIEGADMTDAVNKALEVSESGDVVLLSPACKSFDMFNDYEYRGREFKRIVNSL